MLHVKFKISAILAKKILTEKEKNAHVLKDFLKVKKYAKNVGIIANPVRQQIIAKYV